MSTRLALSTLALSFVHGAALAAPSPCRLSGPSPDWHGLEVQPEGEGPGIALRLFGANVEVALDEVSSRGEVTVEVTAPIVFALRMPLVQVPIGLRRAGRLSPFVVASEATWLVPEARDGDRLTVRLGLGARWRADPIQVACSRLRLRSNRRVDEADGVAGTLMWRRPTLTLFAREGGGAVHTLVERGEAGTRAELALTPLRERRGWTEVEARFTDGTQIRGWASNDQLSRRQVLGRMGHMGYGTLGCATTGAERRITLEPGAPIFDARDGRVWAHAAGTTPAGTLAVEEADGWSRVTRLPGVLPDTEPMNAPLEFVWVRTRDLVTLGR